LRKSVSVLVLLSLFSLVLPAFSISSVRAAEDSWTTLEPPPTGFYRGAAVVDGKIYLVGSNITTEYDSETNTWTVKAPPPIPNYWGTVVACQNKIYLIGGNASKPTQVYDPATDTWENRTSIPTTRSSLQANVVDDKIYVIGGQKLAGLGVINPSSANDVYDPATDSWSQMAPIPTPVMGYASAVLDNKIYIISGGHNGGPDYKPINQVQIFDPETNQWTNGTSIPTGVAYSGACATQGLLAPKRIYVIGGTTNYYFREGYSARASVNLNQVYEPETRNWSVATSMPTSRYGLTLVNLNDELYAIGDNYNEKYTPAGYIPEFPSWTPLLITLVTVVAVIVIYRRSLRKHVQRRDEQ
jgi:N-acetylneuraminic acid mutarotase